MQGRESAVQMQSPLDALMMNSKQSNDIEKKMSDLEEQEFIGEQQFRYEHKVFNEHKNPLQHQDLVAPEQQLTMKVTNNAMSKKDDNQEIESEQDEDASPAK